jgi:hypothetical protein
MFGIEHMKASSPRYRRALLASAAGVAALAGSLLLSAASTAQPAGSPVTPTITLVLSPATVDYGHQSVTVSGTVTTSGGPVAGAAVTISYEDNLSQTAHISVTTDSAGGYSGTIPDPEAAVQVITASVAATSSTAVASASARLGFATDAVTITASFAPPYVNAGSTATLSGVASYVSEGAPHPLSNSTLSISSSGDFALPAISATVITAADGSFSYVTPQVGTAQSSTELTVSSAATPYLAARQLSVTLNINQAAGIFDFSGRIGADRVLVFSACGGIGEPLQDVPLTGPLDYQYSRTPHGPWKTLGTGKLNLTGPCYTDNGGQGDGNYPGKFTAPLASAYYRACAPAVPFQMSAVSQVIHLWKYSTRITGFAITPRSVSRDGKVTVSGRLWRLFAGKRTPEARQRIVIEFRYKNKTYTLSRRLVTDSAGRFRGSFAVPRTAAWLALFKGGGKDFATASKAVVIRVR